MTDSIVSLFKNDFEVFSLVINLSAIGSIISCCEWLYLGQHNTDNGIFGWKVRKYARSYFVNGISGRIATAMFSYPQVIILYFLQLTSSLLIFFSRSNVTLLLIECLTISLTSILLVIRNNDGNSGADKMVRIIFTLAFICLLTDNLVFVKYALAFIAVQLIIAYSTSGWVRIFQPTWRDGSDLRLVLRQHTYSHRQIWTFVRNRPGILKILSLSVLLFECSFIITPFLQMNILLVYLFFGVLFHLSTAAIMGLNNFVWPFLGSYPAVIWLSIKVITLVN